MGPRSFACSILLLCLPQVHAQVNAYAEVTAISGTTLTVASVNEAFDTFEDGEQAILMQMQDDVIGPYLTNNVLFGGLYGISSGGNWEVVTIASHVEAAGLPISVVVTSTLAHTFHFGVKCRVQLISFPELGTPNYTTAGPISAIAWNGITGGVVAFQVSGILTLADDISADYCGFRGGVASTNLTGSCAPFTYTTSSTGYGEKGEGLQRMSSTAYRYGRGRFLNGGGGGNPRNAGGAGGGHVTMGGAGGGGYSCGTPGAGGIGGRELAPYIYWDRFFMGGGGGGGQQNNSIGGGGGAGGGIVIVKADTLATLGPCATLYISANGANGGSSIGPVPDGAGGGGAGGTVYLNVNIFQIDPSCQIICEANGGLGGEVLNTTPPPGNWVDTNGGGGGGGQGAVMCTGSAAGISGGTASGTGGTHDPGGGHAPNGTGGTNAGVIGFGGLVSLPVELVLFTGTDRPDAILLEWTTATEINTDRFEVERSMDGIDWHTLTEVPAAGNSQQALQYSTLDRTPAPGINYYRLRIRDHDGSSELSSVIGVKHEQGSELLLQPVPADDILWIDIGSDDGAIVELFDAAGRPAHVASTIYGTSTSLNTSALPPGPWWLRATLPDGSVIARTIVIMH